MKAGKERERERCWERQKLVRDVKTREEQIKSERQGRGRGKKQVHQEKED